MIILIEGIPGSGKSTTAKKLANYLLNKGLESDFFFEYDHENPVGLPWSFDQASHTIKSTSLEQYPFDSWGNLALRNDHIILESRFLQNTILFSLLNGQSLEDSNSFPQRILNYFKEDEVALIFFHHSNPSSHLQDIIQARAKVIPEWFPFVSQLFFSSKWNEVKKYSLDEVFEKMNVDWAEIQYEKVQDLDVNKFIVTDAAVDWNDSLCQIYGFLDRILEV